MSKMKKLFAGLLAFIVTVTSVVLPARTALADDTLEILVQHEAGDRFNLSIGLTNNSGRVIRDWEVGITDGRFYNHPDIGVPNDNIIGVTGDSFTSNHNTFVTGIIGVQ